MKEAQPAWARDKHDQQRGGPQEKELKTARGGGWGGFVEEIMKETMCLMENTTNKLHLYYTSQHSLTASSILREAPHDRGGTTTVHNTGQRHNTGIKRRETTAKVLSRGLEKIRERKVLVSAAVWLLLPVRRLLMTQIQRRKIHNTTLSKRKTKPDTGQALSPACTFFFNSPCLI